MKERSKKKKKVKVKKTKTEEIWMLEKAKWNELRKLDQVNELVKRKRKLK